MSCDISLIISWGFSWYSRIISNPTEIPILMIIFNRHKDVEYPFVINLLHLLCGSYGNRISKEVLWELGSIILFNSMTKYEISILIDYVNTFKHWCKLFILSWTFLTLCKPTWAHDHKTDPLWHLLQVCQYS